MLIYMRLKVQINVKSIFKRKIDVESFSLRIKMAEEENVIYSSDKKCQSAPTCVGSQIQTNI